MEEGGRGRALRQDRLHGRTESAVVGLKGGPEDLLERRHLGVRSLSSLPLLPLILLLLLLPVPFRMIILPPPPAGGGGEGRDGYGGIVFQRKSPSRKIPQSMGHAQPASDS